MYSTIHHLKNLVVVICRHFLFRFIPNCKFIVKIMISWIKLKLYIWQISVVSCLSIKKDSGFFTKHKHINVINFISNTAYLQCLYFLSNAMDIRPSSADTACNCLHPSHVWILSTLCPHASKCSSFGGCNSQMSSHEIYIGGNSVSKAFQIRFDLLQNLFINNKLLILYSKRAKTSLR